MLLKKNLLLFLFFIFSFFGILSFYFFKIKPKKTAEAPKISILEPLVVYKKEETTVLGLSDISKTNKDLKKELNNILSPYQNSVSLGVYFIDSNDSVKINPSYTYYFPQMINLVMALSILERVNKNSLSLDEYVQGIKVSQHLNNLFALPNESKKSREILKDFLEEDYLEKKVKEYGLNNTSISKNTTNVSDTILIWKNIYKRAYLDDNYTEYLLNLLSKIKDTSLISTKEPYFLLGNKEGSPKRSVLILGQSPYIVSVLTKDLSSVQAKILFPRIFKVLNTSD